MEFRVTVESVPFSGAATGIPVNPPPGNGWLVVSTVWAPNPGISLLGNLVVLWEREENQV